MMEDGSSIFTSNYDNRATERLNNVWILDYGMMTSFICPDDRSNERYVFRKRLTESLFFLLLEDIFIFKFSTCQTYKIGPKVRDHSGTCRDQLRLVPNLWVLA